MALQGTSKKRKVSALTAKDTTSLLSALAVFQSTLDEDDDELPPDLIPALETLRAKLEVKKYTAFSKADPFTVVEAKIRTRPLFLREDKRAEIEALGKANTVTSSLSFEETVELLTLVRKHVSTATEAGCRVLINMMLLRLASAMQDEKVQLNIIPEFPIPKTTFEMNSGEQTFSGVVDFLLARIPPRYSSFLLDNPVGALANPNDANWSVTPTIIEAKRDKITLAVPKATLVVAAYCKQHDLSVLRGCITSGEQWSFFIYKSEGARGEVHVAHEISLGASFENLPLVLGLFHDLVENALAFEQKYFSYT